MQSQQNISRGHITTRDWTDFPTRVITALVAAPLALGAVFAGAPFFDALMFALGVLAAVELSNVINPRYTPTRVLIFAAVAIVMIATAYVTAYLYLLPLVLLLMGSVAALLARARGAEHDEAWLDNGLYPVLGAIYVALAPALMILIRSGEGGLLFINVVIWTVWFTDTFALVGGRLIGRHKLAPHISPGKTIEGALVGILFGMVVGMSILIIGGRPVYMAVSLSATIAGMAVAGDLLESWLKRHFHVKDSGAILPGHGGVLDRIDGFLGTVPVYYLMLIVFAFVMS